MKKQKKIPFYRSINTKLIALVNLVLILTILLFAIYNINVQKRQRIEEVVRGANRISDTVRNTINFAIAKNDKETIQKIIEKVGKQEDIRKIRIYDKEGKIIFSSSKSEIGKFLHTISICHKEANIKNLFKKSTSKKEREIYEINKENRVLCLLRPISHTHSILDMHISLLKVDKEINRNRLQILLLAIISITLVSLIIFVFGQRFINRPIKEILAGMRGVANGNLNYSIPITSCGEFAYLANSFNQMTDNLKKAVEEIQNKEIILEQKVKELDDTREQLVRSAKFASLGKLAAGVAHEINNPLAIVLNFSHILLRKLKGELSYEANLETIIKQTTRCSEIVKGLLDFAKEEPPEKKEIDINELIEKTLSLLINQSLFLNIETKKDFNVNLPKIMVDPDQLQQVFMNIMINAAEAMKDGGSLTITTRCDTNFVEVEFTDTGCGIPSDFIDRIFDPFFTTKEVGQGIGLGLAVTYGIIQRHNGSIEVKSKEGVGTTFIVKLPIGETSQIT